MKKIDADKNVGYSGSMEGQELSNGEAGVDSAKRVLVVCCGNCGEYRHLLLRDIKRGPKGKVVYHYALDGNDRPYIVYDK